MNPSPPQRFPFAGFYIGPVVTALVLSAGILALVYAIRDPLTAIIITGINCAPNLCGCFSNSASGCCLAGADLLRNRSGPPAEHRTSTSLLGSPH